MDLFSVSLFLIFVLHLDLAFPFCISAQAFPVLILDCLTTRIIVWDVLSLDLDYGFPFTLATVTSGNWKLCSFGENTGKY